MLCFWSGFFVPVSVRKREMHNKTGSLPWPHRESVVARQNKAEIYVINILYRSRLSWDGLWRPPPKPKLDFGYLCRRYLLNQNLIQWCVWYTQLMPSWKQLVAICLQNPITSPPQWARFCCQDLSCEVHGMSFVDTCVIAAGSGPTKGILAVAGEGAGWRFSHEMGFRWKMSASQNPNFSWERMYHMQQKWYSWSQWEKGETKKNKERRGRILPYPRIRSMSANDIYMRWWSPVPVVISMQREITDRMLWCILSI